MLAALFVKGQVPKPDTNKYYFPYTLEQLRYLQREQTKVDSILANSTMPAKDAIAIIQFLNSLQDAFLQNYKIQVAEMEKKKVQTNNK